MTPPPGTLLLAVTVDPPNVLAAAMGQLAAVQKVSLAPLVLRGRARVLLRFSDGKGFHSSCSQLNLSRFCL